MADDTPSLDELYRQVLTPPPPVQPDQTPVDTSGFWGGLRHGISLFGEALGGGRGTPGYAALSPAEREAAGANALMNFGTSLMAASRYQPGQTIFSNLAQGFQGAQRSYQTAEQQAAELLGAKQAYQSDQQAQQLARIKEAIPLLTLKQQMQQAADAARLANNPTPGTSVATGGTIAPFIAANLPEGVSPAEDQIVRTVIGEASNQGQIGQQAVAHVIKNRMAAGGQGAQDVIFAPNQFEPWNNAKTRATLEAIDPKSQQYQDILNNVVRPVMAGTAKDPTGGATHFFSPTAQKALGRNVPDWAQGQTPTVIGQHNFYRLPYAPTAPAPGQTAAAPGGQPAPPAPVGQNPGAKVQIPPPPAPGTAARPTLPAPEAPIAPGAGAQVAGPGAPTSGAIPPSPPGSDADVKDIISGMVARGADPNTLAPGPGSAPAPQGGAVAVAGAPQAPPVLQPDLKAGDVTVQHPGSFATFYQKEYVPPPATENFNPNITPAQQASFDLQRKQISTLPFADQPKAYAELNAAIRTATEAKAKDAAAAVSTYDQQQRTAIQTRYDAAVTNYNTVANELQKQQNAQQDAVRKQADELARIAATGEQTRQTDVAQLQNQASRKLVEDLNTETVAARSRIGALEAVLELSRNVKDPTLLATKTIGGVPMVDLLKGLGIGTEAFQNRLSAIQALRSGIENVTKAMRNGVALGNASDADLRFIKGMGPSEMEDDSTREAIVANLLGQQYRQQRFNTEVNKQIADGKKSGEAIDIANEKIPPVTPTMPKELQDAPRGDPRVAEWFDINVPPNTIWADAKGKRHIYHSPGWQPPQRN